MRIEQRDAKDPGGETQDLSAADLDPPLRRHPDILEIMAEERALNSSMALRMLRVR